ncbi:MAG: twin-arginine translocation signal domain-containing protein, partial [Planctomycetaceae bacterium]|nr:twin-arginine translocation signal domain-containing protein [Planctomycetaceae bacterium]
MEHVHTRRTFLKAAGVAALSTGALSSGVYAADDKVWKVAIHQDTSVKMLGGHGLETAFRGLPN